MKAVRTGILVLTVLFAAMLWITKSEWLPSQSAFALSENVIWYYLMHASIITTFALESFKSLEEDREFKAWWSALVAFATLGIVIFDMYSYPVVHNVSTGVMAALAAGNLIYFASKKERPLAIMNCGVGALFFMLGFLIWDVHLFFGEVIIEFTIGVAMVRRIWLEE
jgi:hypothetical protein